MKRCDLQPWSRFGRLVTTWDVERRKKLLYEKCVCDCWNVKWVPRWNLVHWTAKSCWCFQKECCREIQSKFFKKHWMAKSRIYRIYGAIKGRVGDKNRMNYKYYWWRWIKCLWESFEEFYKDMWESYKDHVNKYWEKNTTIDRIDCDWDYCKENCRWATWAEQRLNHSAL